MYKTFLAGNIYSKQKAWGYLLAFPAYLYYIPTILHFIFLIILDLTNEHQVMMANIYLNLGVGLISLAIIALILKDFLIENFIHFKQNFLATIKNIFVIGLPLNYLLAFIANILVMLFLGFDVVEDSANQQAVVSMIEITPLLMVFQAVIIAPLLEELLFRGLIFRSLTHININLAHFVAAFLFGFLHVYQEVLAGDLMQMAYIFPYMFMGYAFGYIYQRTGTIFASIGLHFLSNSIAVLLSLTM